MKVTQARGSADTPGAPWVLVESGARPILITMFMALFLHFVPPMVPLQSILGWAGLAFHEDEDDDDLPESPPVIPIDLDMFYDEAPARDGVEEGGAEPPPEPDVVPPEPAVVVPKPEPEPEKAPPPPPPPPKKPEPQPEPKPEEKPVAKRKLRLKGALEEAGDNSVARPEHPNVNIYIAGAELRKRDLAPMFGELLNAVPEWEGLLGGTDINPIQNFDHVLITTPHMRKKAKWVVARVQYNVPDARMKNAIGTAAKRSKGKWLDGYDLPVASLDKDRRRAVLIADKNQLVVLPKEAQKQIPKLHKVGAFPDNPSAGIYLDIVTPANAFKRVFDFPKSIEKLTLRFSLAENDGYLVEVEMIDESEESAKKHAKSLAEELEKIRPIPLLSLFAKKYFIGKPTFTTEGDIIRARAPVSRAQVARIMELVKIWLEGRAEKQAKKKAKKKKADDKKKKKAEGKRAKASEKPATGRRVRAEARKGASKKKKKKSGGLFDGMRDAMGE